MREELVLKIDHLLKQRLNGDSIGMVAKQQSRGVNVKIAGDGAVNRDEQSKIAGLGRDDKGLKVPEFRDLLNVETEEKWENPNSLKTQKKISWKNRTNLEPCSERHQNLLGRY